MDALEKFEQDVMREFSLHHAAALVRKCRTVAEENADVTDPDALFQQEMMSARQLRVVTLALEEYHGILSRHLKGLGVELPPLRTLISESVEE